MNYTNGLPKGAVIMWHGEVEDIPDGWAICDGKDGLTPDLRSRFVVGVHYEKVEEKKIAEDKINEELKKVIDTINLKQEEANKEYALFSQAPQVNTQNWVNYSKLINQIIPKLQKEKEALNERSIILSMKPILNDSGGANRVQLTIDEMPKHNHELRRSNDASNQQQGWIGTNKTYFPAIWATDREGNLSNEPMSTSGGNQPHENRPPFYALFFIKRII